MKNEMADTNIANDLQGPRQQVVAYTEKSQDKHESRHIQLVREYGFHPRSKVSVEDGAMLPKKFEPFPKNMYGKPLEEIDNFIYEETFCVVSKRFQKNYIHRFTGTKSLFLFTPWSYTRRMCVYLATNQYFDYIVMATILLNCVFLALRDTVEEAEYIFLIIYTAEMVIKIIAKGFVLNKYTYLRNPWNWLDFVVITSGYATIGKEIGNLAGLRTFRVLRALKTISIMPGLKTIINALLHSFRQLAEVITLTIFCLMVFALFALQVYMGELRNKCVRNHPNTSNITYDEWQRWINDSRNWRENEDGMFLLCGNVTGSRHCPSDHTCLCIGENPNHGYTNFDNFLWSMLTTFQLITLDYWENVYNMILATSGPMSVSFFTIVVFFGSFYLINLMLAVVALSYEEEAEITLEERKKDLLDHRDDSTFSFDPSNLNLKKLNKNERKKIDSRKGVLLASYSRKKTRRRKGKIKGEHDNSKINNKSITSSLNPSPRHGSVRPHTFALQKTCGAQNSATHNPNKLYPLGANFKGQPLSSSKQLSLNASEGGVNRESSLDDSGVVDDHDEHDVTGDPIQFHNYERELTPVALSLSPREVKVIKCNGNIARLKQHNVYALHPEYLSQIVVLDDLPDRNCDKCVQCCVDYEGWLQFQNCLYKVVKDPLFELAITLCIVLNTIFLALEHHGMSENLRQALNIGNKVFTSIFAFECILKLMALSRDFFLCGWNIFDLIIVSASLLDIIYEYLEDLIVLRVLRLLRVLKLAQSWTTMKVLLSIIISSIGALGNLTLVLVIVIYIFAVIGMQLFSKDYTADKFLPDARPRWNFDDFFHSFMMIFRILCGEWIEPLWDCMRAEEGQGASTCFAIFLPTLVMGNFMVLNLFLALLLNSFNSEELKNKKEEVGETSKLARSFERIRSIVRKNRLINREKTENEHNTKLEQLVKEIMYRRKNEKELFNLCHKEYLSVESSQKILYTQRYQESENGPISEMNYNDAVQIKPAEQVILNEIDKKCIELEDKNVKQDDNKILMKERTFLRQMSSGFGTQQNASKDETTLTESMELKFLGPINSTDSDSSDTSSKLLFTNPFGKECLSTTNLLKEVQGPCTSVVFSNKRSTIITQPPVNCQNISEQDDSSLGSSIIENVENYLSIRNNRLNAKHTSQMLNVRRSPSYHKSMNRLPSDQSIKTWLSDQDELRIQINLKDELLSCDRKELFQFLKDDFDNSNNYFSKRIECGNTITNPNPGGPVLDSKEDDLLFSTRKLSSGSLKSNFSNISNSIFQTLEIQRGGSFTGSIDKIFRLNDITSQYNINEKDQLMRSDFDNLIDSFDKELTDLKIRSTASIEKIASPTNNRKKNYLSQLSNKTKASKERPESHQQQKEFEENKVTRRSLEKQNNISEDDFEDSSKLKKNCTHIPPFNETSSNNKLRYINNFHTSFGRIKRTSLIERVEEDYEEYVPTFKIESEKLPRKFFSKDLQSTSSTQNHYISHEDFPSKSINKIEKKKLSQKSVVLKESDCHKKSGSAKENSDKNEKNCTMDEDREKPWYCLVSYVDDLTVGGRRNSKGFYEEPSSFPSFGTNKVTKIPQDCLPQRCYDRFQCWEKLSKSNLGNVWLKTRTIVLSVVDTPAFEWFVLVLIFASSITLCFEDIYLDSNKSLKKILYWTNLGFCLIFIVEMILKWIALGFTKYFSNFWTILDFIIVFVSVFSLLIEENENLKVLRSLRTLRALRPLRAISRWQGMRIVVNALMYAIPSIFNVLLVCLVFWLIFSIMGVQFFGGRFFKCVNETGDLLPVIEVNDRFECLMLNYTWKNSKITFDHVGMGYLALLQVATFEGWMEVMKDAVDARGVDLQPKFEANIYAYLYFVIFIVCGSFFTLNLFIGVIIDNFNMLKKKYEGGVLEMFLTESQKHYYTAMKKLGRKKPQKVIKRPINNILAIFYDLSNSRRFEIAIFVLIFLNMLAMGIEYYNQPDTVKFILNVSNAFFTTVFGLEAIVKIAGLRHHYFTVPWNVFDFLLVLASIFGIMVEDIKDELIISPTLLRVVRVFRIGRILRLIKAAKGIRKLLFALVVSLPALFNIGALLALITFIYAILGMSLFGNVKLQGALDDMVNFQTFGRSMQLLFRLMTSAGWNDVLESLMVEPPECDINFNNQTNGNCGHSLLAITYFTSFIIISYMIVINMYIAIILENFNQAHQEEEIGIVEDDLEMFYIRWSKYDPHATQFILFSQLSDFIGSLDPPLGIPKPNTVALVSFNLPISSGNKIHCLDILHALVKHVLGHVEETENFKQLQEQMDIKFKKQFPTRKELEIVSSTRIWKRQDKAARLIQIAWKEYIRLKKERERSPTSIEDEHTQTSSPGGWQSKLSALNFLHLQVHRRGTATSSRASSRKSSRASDASDMSELAGPWLNLPAMMIPYASDLVKDLKTSQNTEENLEAKPVRRRSFYNFFLRHQDTVDDSLISPSVSKKSTTPSGTISFLNNADAKQVVQSITTPKSKRATSFIKKKPPLERGLSAQSALRLNKNAFVYDDPKTSQTEVSILVTEPSPEGINPPRDSTVVHVLVHRESEEYQNDLISDDTKSADKQKHSETNVTADLNEIRICDVDANIPQPIVKIMIESPKDPPQSDFLIESKKELCQYGIPTMSKEQFIDDSIWIDKTDTLNENQDSISSDSNNLNQKATFESTIADENFQFDESS